MAIDTRNKRGSAIGLGLILILPLANGDIDAADRQQVSHIYAGISVGVPVIPPAVLPSAELDDFFDIEDGFVTVITLSSGVVLTGYFDIIDSEFYLDDDLSIVKAEFVCESITDSETLAGNSVSIGSDVYRVSGVLPDGTGLMTLSLLRTT